MRVYGICEYKELSFNLPLYNGDLEKDGRPEIVETLAAKLKPAAGVIIMGPEINKRPSGVLKMLLTGLAGFSAGYGKTNLSLC